MKSPIGPTFFSIFFPEKQYVVLKSHIIYLIYSRKTVAAKRLAQKKEKKLLIVRYVPHVAPESLAMKIHIRSETILI